MHIRTFFTNADFLKKSARRLVCVLVLLAAASCVWGADAYFIWIGSNEGNLWSNPCNWKYSSSGRDYQEQSSGGFYPGDGRSTDKQIWFPGTDNGTFYIVVDREIHTGELGFHSDGRGMASTYIFSATNGGSIEASSISVKAPPDSSKKSVLNFGNVPVTVKDGNFNINAGETAGTVEIATDSSITVEGCMNIGKYDQNGSNNTKTVFSGSGSVTTKTLDFPNANNHELTIEEGVALGFSSGGTFYQDTSGSITINGSGTIDFQNAGIDTTNNGKPQGLHISPDIIVLNPPGNNTYTMTVGTMTGFPSSSVQSVTIHIVASTTESSLNDRYKKFLYTFSQNGNQFTFNGNNNASSQIQLSSGSGNSYSGDFTLSYNNSDLSAGNGFTLTIYRPDGIVLGTVSWYQGVPGWTGASSTAWNTLGNWTGITDLGDLSTKDISINSSAQNQPEISTDVQVKTLTITNNATVTQTEGSFSVESITCQGTGKFIDDGGTVQFNGSDGTYSAVYNGDTYFNNVSIESGKKLTLNSDLYLKGNLTVNGTLTQNGKSLVFCGGSSQTISGVTSLDAITVKNGARVTLGADFTVGKLTVESGGTLDCSGHTLTITDSSTIAGTVTAEKCIATGIGGKTLTINGTLSVSDTLTLEGTDAGHKLVITGGGTIKLAESQTGGKWLDVTYGTVPVVHDSSDGTTVTYTASYSSGPATNPTGWKIFSGASVYTWTGNAGSNDWGTAGNWDVNAVPDENSAVTIETTSGKPDPVTSSVLTLASLTVKSGKGITLGGNLTVTGELKNEGTVDTNGKALSFASYSDPSTGNIGTIKVGASNTVSSTAAATVGKIIFSGTRTGFTETTFTNIVFTNIEVAANSSLSLGDTLSVSGTLTNNGTISTDGKSITTGTFAGSGSIELKGAVTLTGGGTVTTLKVTDTASFTTSGSATYSALTVNAGTLTLQNDFTASTLTNAGTINTNGKNLSFATVSDTGTIQLAAAGTLAVLSGGSGGTINRLQFTANRSFSNITGLAFKDCIIDAGKTLTLGSNLTLGTLDNRGTVNAAGYALSFATYTNGAGTQTDAVTVNGGSITATGTGGTISSATLNGTSSVTNSGTGTLMLTAASVTSNNAVLTVAKSGSATLPELIDVSVTSSTAKLTLNSSLTVSGTFTNNGTVSFSDKTLTAGTFAGNGGYTVSGAVTLSSGTSTTPGTVASVTTNGTTTFTQTGNYTLSSFTVSSENAVTLGSNLISTTLHNNGSIISSGKNITCTTYTPSSNDSMTLSGNVSLSIGSGTVSTLNYSSGTLTPGAAGLSVGSLNVAAGPAELAGTMNMTSLTVAGSTTVSGTTTVTGNVTASADLTVSGPTTVSGILTATDCNVTIDTGKALVAAKYSQTISSSGKSLTLNGTLRIGGSGTSRDTLRLSGNTSNRLTVKGSGTIMLNASQVGGDYLDLSQSPRPSVAYNASETDVICTAKHSSGSSGNGWNICSGDLVYEWIGGDGTTDAQKSDWNRYKNWTVHIVPGVVTGESYAVKIPSSASADVSVTVPVNVATLEIETGRKLTQHEDVVVSSVLTNAGTINMNGNNMTFLSYTGSGDVKIGATGSITATGTAPCGTINKLIFTGTRPFSNIPKLAFRNAEVGASGGANITLTFGDAITFTGTLTNYATVVQNGNLNVTGALTNYGTIDMQNNDLTCASYTDDAANSFIKLGTGRLALGAGSTLNNLVFTATRNFENISGPTITNGILDADKTLTITSGGLSFNGNFENNGNIIQTGDLTVAGTLTNKRAINIGSNRLCFGLYLHTGVSDDTLTIAGGSVTASAGGNGTGMIAVSSLTMNGNATVTNNSNGALKFTAVTVNAVSQLSAGGTGNAPVFSALNITSNSTLTLASNISAGNVIIADGATLDADSRGVTPAADSATSAYGCTTFGGGNVLTVSGNFINNNTGHSNATPYPGFVAQHGRVEITGNGTHEIRGNNKFHDFVCISPGATLIFDANKTTNVDHQIWLEGSGSNLITLKTDNAAEGDKWTLDVIWSDVDGTAEHRKPHINYVAPHKSRSYSAKLKGCLVGCVDDAPSLRDSTNVNWFDDMPTIIMTVAPVGGKQLAVMFSSEVDAVSGTDLRTSVALKTNTGSNLIDLSVPVSMYTGSSDKSKTTVVYGLTRELTWNDLFGSDCLHVEVIQSDAVLVRGTNIKYQQGVKHCASDFAINAARMLFGYDNYIDSSTPLTIEKGSNSVRTWDQSDPISNRLHSDSDLLFQAQFDASVPTGMKLEMVAMLDSQLNKSIISDNYMDYYGLSTRLWLPTQFQPISTAQQSVPSSQMISQDSTSSGRLRNFSLHYSKTSSSPLFQMKDGEEIQFLFKVKNSDNSDLSVDHDYVFENGVFTPVSGPVYAIRLVDDADITSFDLWSVMLEATKLQRGNVTILNNVINSDQREQTFVTIQMQKAGSLTVQVLTLDGSVITTLQRGRKAAGTYGYSWDGTNGKGKAVARGMYFIRVIGPDIDETRKVMVVRD